MDVAKEPPWKGLRRVPKGQAPRRPRATPTKPINIAANNPNSADSPNPAAGHNKPPSHLLR